MRKTVYKIFSYAECDKFAAYLKDMAFQGWHFIGWDKGLVFEKGESKKTEYAVEVVVQKNKDEKQEEQQKREFADYCEMAGWKRVAVRGRFYVFEKSSEDAFPIMEPEEKFRNIKKTILRERLRGMANPFVISFWFLWCILSGDVITWLFQDGTFLLTAIPVVAFFFTICSWIHVKLWKADKKLWITNRMQFAFNRIWEIALLAVLVGMQQYKVTGIFGLLFLLNCFEEAQEILWKKEGKNSNAERRIALTLVIMLVVRSMSLMLEEPKLHLIEITKEEELLFSQKDFKEIEWDFEKGSYYELEADAGTVKSYSSLYSESEKPDSGRDSFSCMIYESEYDWVLDRVWEESSQYINEDIQDDTEKWKAEKAISGIYESETKTGGWLSQNVTVVKSYSNCLHLIRYEDKVVYISEANGLTQEQINIICEKLDLR